MTNPKLQLILLLLISLITFVADNGAIDANIMEARNLTTARELLQKNNWLAPTMNGELRIEKPPLPTWIAAGAIYLFGEENLSLLRLPAALAAILLVFSLFKLTTSLSSDRLLPFLAAGTAATSFYILFLGRDISWDIFCHSFMICAIWLIHSGLKSERSKWLRLILAGVLMALSFLSKGPVAFYALLLPYVIARTITFGWEEARTKRLPLIVMILVALALSIWWPIVIWYSNPGEVAQIAHNETSAWFVRNTRPFYHYWSFPVQAGVWGIVGAVSLFYPYAKERINRFGNYRFLFSWAVSAVILLSLFPEKKERYLLPVLLPMALLTAYYFRYLTEAFRESATDKTGIMIIRFNAGLMGLICFAVPLLVMFGPLGKLHKGLAFLILVIILFWGLTWLFLVAFRKKDPIILWSAMVGMVVTVCFLMVPSIVRVGITNPDYHPYKELRSRSDLKDIPFFFNGLVPGKFIEVVWSSGHSIDEWNPATMKQLPVNPPLLFLSAEDPLTVLPAEIIKNHQIEVIGYFDSNLGKHEAKNVLSNYATIIR